MRLLLLSLLALTGCSKESPAPPGAPGGTFIGAGRNAMCIAGGRGAQRAGIIVYGEGNLNCSASGTLEVAGGAMTLVPSGDAECRIPITLTAGTMTIGALPAACAYYCATGARLDGQAFTGSAEARPVTDFAGDPLC